MATSFSRPPMYPDGFYQVAFGTIREVDPLFLKLDIERLVINGGDEPPRWTYDYFHYGNSTVVKMDPPLGRKLNSYMKSIGL